MKRETVHLSDLEKAKFLWFEMLYEFMRRSQKERVEEGDNAIVMVLFGSTDIDVKLWIRSDT